MVTGGDIGCFPLWALGPGLVGILCISGTRLTVVTGGVYVGVKGMYVTGLLGTSWLGEGGDDFIFFTLLTAL